MKKRPISATIDIVRLQEQTQGKIAFMGGIETNEVDTLSSTEEQVRAEVRRAYRTYGPQGYRIPSITYGNPSAPSSARLPTPSLMTRSTT